MVIENSVLNSLHNASKTDTALNKTVARLSYSLQAKNAGGGTGQTASGVTHSQIRGLERTNRGIQNGVSLIQTANGALGEMNSVLQRIRELVVEADGADSSETEEIKNEVAALRAEYDGVVNNTKFDNRKLLEGSYTAEIRLDADTGEAVTINIGSMQQSVTGLNNLDDTGFEIGTSGAIEVVDDAIAAVSSQQSYLSGVQNRLEEFYSNRASTVENTAALKTGVSGFDIAQGILNSNQQVMSEMLAAQSNMEPQAVMKLLS
ncbi:MAG: flagellin [Bacillota bacterium]